MSAQYSNIKSAYSQHLARRIALWSFFAVSAISGRTRETLQLRRIWKFHFMLALMKFEATVVEY